VSDATGAVGRHPIIAANWKMHHDHLVAIHTVQKLAFLLEKDDYEAVDVVICPPFTDIRPLQNLMDADKIPMILGAQNCHWEDQGAYTGEVSPPMLAKLNVRYVIVGHSERRQLFGETDETVNKKLKAVLKHGMSPIVCVGETLEEREAGGTTAKVDGQTRAAFDGVKAADAEGCVVAYEPIWAIGTGRNATPEDADETCGEIRAVLRDLYRDVADSIRIQYGGSVKPGNAAELMGKPQIDGALVGGASLDADDFAKIIRYR
jgi:triosephosphate isomerase (TIM)